MIKYKQSAILDLRAGHPNLVTLIHLTGCVTLGKVSKLFGTQCITSEIETVKAYIMSYVGPPEYTHLLIDKFQLTVSWMNNHIDS